MRQTVDCIRLGGTAVISGVLAPGVDVALDGLGLLGRTVIGNVEGSSVPEEYLPKLVEFWRRADFPFDKLTTRTYALEDINQAIADMETGDVIKPVVRYWTAVASYRRGPRQPPYHRCLLTAATLLQLQILPILSGHMFINRASRGFQARKIFPRTYTDTTLSTSF